MANYSELLNDINAAIYENNDQEIDALEVRAILREMVTSLGSGFLFKGIATPSSPSGTGTYEPDQNVFYLATTAGTYTYLGGLVVAAGEVAFLCFDGTWTKKSSALLSTGSIVDNTTTDDATKPLSAKQGKVLADAGAATAAEVTALGQEVDGIRSDVNGQNQEIADFEETITNQIDNFQPIVIEGNVTNAPDEEDITTDENDLLKFANRGTLHGLGYVILRRDKTFAEQVTLANTIYEIRYDFDLGGASVTIPAGCMLRFIGGKIVNGQLVGDYTRIDAGIEQIFDDITINGIWLIDYAYPEWFGAIGDGETNDTLALQKTFDSFNRIRLSGVTYAIYGEQNATEILSINQSLSIYGVYNQTIIKAFNVSEDCDVIRGFVDGITIENVIFEGQNEESRNGRGFHHLRRSGYASANLYLKCCTFRYFSIGLYAQSYSNRFDVCRSINNGYGYIVDTSTEYGGIVTSNVFIKCSASHNDNDGYQLNNLNYSSLLSCTADRNGGTAYKLQTCRDVSLLYCGSEYNNKGVYCASGNCYLSGWFLVNLANYNDSGELSRYIEFGNGIFNKINLRVLGQNSYVDGTNNPPQDFVYVGQSSNVASPNVIVDVYYGFGNTYTAFTAYNEYVLSAPFVYSTGGYNYNRLTVNGENENINGPIFNNVTHKKPNFLFAGKWYDADGFKALLRKGSSGDRPTLESVDAGFPYFDTTLKKPIWSRDGSNWFVPASMEESISVQIVSYYGSMLRIYDIDEWVATNNAQIASGVLITFGDRSIMIPPTHSQNMHWSSANTIVQGGSVLSNVNYFFGVPSGKDATDAIINSFPTDTSAQNAAKYCKEYAGLTGNTRFVAGDWWLPSMAEMLVVLARRNEINYALSFIPNSMEIPSNASYWVADEYTGGEHAWYINVDGAISHNTKSGGSHRTMPICALQNTSHRGPWARRPTSDVPIGYEYFCTDKQTTEGSSDGIMIYHKGNGSWVDALGRTIS